MLKLIELISRFRRGTTCMPDNVTGGKNREPPDTKLMKSNTAGNIMRMVLQAPRRTLSQTNEQTVNPYSRQATYSPGISSAAVINKLTMPLASSS
jgi:hypothetical protein